VPITDSKIDKRERQTEIQRKRERESGVTDTIHITGNRNFQVSKGPLTVPARLSGKTSKEIRSGIEENNFFRAKRNLLYVRNQSVPRCKHFPSRL